MTPIDNHAICLYDEAERAKVALSSALFEVMRLPGDGIDLWQPISRSRFESVIGPDRRHIGAFLMDTKELRAAWERNGMCSRSV